jgi:hypothetical protein
MGGFAIDVVRALEQLQNPRGFVINVLRINQKVLVIQKI